MNLQPIEKLEFDTLLQVHSIFNTIQGEGPFCGTPAVFIRLAGCNLQCPGCDTDYTSKRTRYSSDQIVEEVNSYSASGLVVITGGEPFRQNITKLIGLLTAFGYYVQIETNGTYPPSRDVMWTINTDFRIGAYIVCSPKTGHINPSTLQFSCCLKYVIDANSVNLLDGLPIKALGHSVRKHVARPPVKWGRPIYVQPMDGGNEDSNKANLQKAIEVCMRHGYILQLQIHKIIGME